MKKALSIILFANLWTGALAATVPWTSVQRVSQATLESRLTRWALPPYQLAPVCVSGFDDNGLIRYSALWEPITDGFVRRTLLRLTVAELSTDIRPDLVSPAGKLYQEVLVPLTPTRRFIRLKFTTH